MMVFSQVINTAVLKHYYVHAIVFGVGVSVGIVIIIFIEKC